VGGTIYTDKILGDSTSTSNMPKLKKISVGQPSPHKLVLWSWVRP